MSGILRAVSEHHEDEDGGGYLKLSGDQIHPYAKILRILDSLETMCGFPWSAREWRTQSWNFDEAVAKIQTMMPEVYDSEYLQALGMLADWHNSGSPVDILSA